MTDAWYWGMVSIGCFGVAVYIAKNIKRWDEEYIGTNQRMKEVGIGVKADETNNKEKSGTEA